MRKAIILIIISIGVWFTSCTSIDNDFPVPEASIVPQFDVEVIDEQSGEVRFLNTSIIPDEAGAVVYNWSFGDGNNSTEESPVHTYFDYGEFEVKLVIIAAESSRIAETKQNLALLQPIKIDFTLFYMDVDQLAIRGVGITDQNIEVAGFGTGLAIDRANDMLYYSDDDNLQIKRVGTDGSNPEVLFEGLTAAGSLALDTENGKVYWTNRVEGAVYRGNMDGSGSAEAIITDLALPEGIAVHGNKVYISDVDVPPIGENIYRADLNGANLEIFVPGSWGYGLAVDSQNETLYFGDQGVYDDPNDNRLKLVSLNDNTDIRTIAPIEAIGTNGSRAYGIAVNHVEGKVYWSDRASDRIKSANLDGSETTTILVVEGQARGIALDY